MTNDIWQAITDKAKKLMQEGRYKESLRCLYVKVEPQGNSELEKAEDLALINKIRMEIMLECKNNMDELGIMLEDDEYEETVAGRLYPKNIPLLTYWQQTVIKVADLVKRDEYASAIKMLEEFKPRLILDIIQTREEMLSDIEDRVKLLDEIKDKLASLSIKN